MRTGTNGLLMSPSQQRARRALLRSRRYAAWLVLALVLPLAASAPKVRPGEQQRPELPPFQPPPEEEGHILPPLQLPPEGGTEGIQVPKVKAAIRRIDVTGDPLLPEAQVREITKPYEQRELAF